MSMTATENTVQRKVAAAVGQVPPGHVPKYDETGMKLVDTGLTASWLANRVTAYRNANGTLVLTTGDAN